MSAQTIALKGAVQAADNELEDWLKGLLSGKGDSPSQVIVSGILSVVPGLGQAMDLRDIVVGIVAISTAPSNPAAWLDIAITLVGCIPVMGDGLKTGFRLMKDGQAMPRILDGLSPKLRGNVDKWFRELDWATLAKSVKSSFDDVIGAFINGLDSWLARLAMGKDEVRHLIRQLEDLRKRAPKMLDEAIEELQRLWKKSMGDTPPKSTASPSAPHAPSHEAATGAPRKTETVTRDKTTSETTTPDKARSEQRRASKKKQDWRTGVPAEHIADYWCGRSKRNLKKANNHGKLWEEWDKAGRQGIDHVWVQSGNTARPGTIGETKSSLFGAFRFMQALPADIRTQMAELGDTDAETTTPNGQPDIFKNEERDKVGSGKGKIDSTPQAEDEMRKGLGKPNADTGLYTQMSHAWIAKAMPKENLTTAGRELAKAVKRYQKQRHLGVTPPYTRWIIMVTGRQKHLHENRQGHKHEIQQPLITLPDNILDK